MDAHPIGKCCGRCARTLPVEQFRLRTQPGRTHQRYSTCNDCWSAKGRRWREANPERANELHRGWAAKDPDHTRAVYRRLAERKRANPINRVHGRIACQFWHFLREGKGGRKSEELLGYSMQELAAHLERQFLKGMSWENMSKWHIDHIVPLSSFTITGPDDPELRRAWALTNLRPLWAIDNQRKHSKRTHLL